MGAQLHNEKMIEKIDRISIAGKQLDTKPFGSAEFQTGHYGQ